MSVQYILNFPSNYACQSFKRAQPNNFVEMCNICGFLPWFSSNTLCYLKPKYINTLDQMISTKVQSDFFMHPMQTKVCNMSAEPIW